MFHYLAFSVIQSKQAVLWPGGASEKAKMMVLKTEKSISTMKSFMNTSCTLGMFKQLLTKKNPELKIPYGNESFSRSNYQDFK